MDVKLKEACKEITKKMYESGSIQNKKDVDEFKSFLTIWQKEIEEIDERLYWKRNS